MAQMARMFWVAALKIETKIIRKIKIIFVPQIWQKLQKEKKQIKTLSCRSWVTPSFFYLSSSEYK